MRAKAPSGFGRAASEFRDARLFVQEICGQIQPGATDNIREEWLGFPAMRIVDGRFPLAQKPGLAFELSEASWQSTRLPGCAPWRACFTKMDR